MATTFSPAAAGSVFVVSVFAVSAFAVSVSFSIPTGWIPVSLGSFGHGEVGLISG
jgi:hypothetical protein